MDAIIVHLQERWMAYAAVLACCLPLLVIFRRQVLPVIWYAAEIVIYICMFHILIHGIVRLARWFKFESTTYIQDKTDPGWQTPLVAMWDREVYNPYWLFYFEIVAVMLIVAAVFRYRPFKAQKLKPRTAPPRKGMASQVRPNLAGKSGVRR